MRKLIYLSTFFQPENAEFYSRNCKTSDNLSASNFSLSLAKGLSMINKEMFIINVPPIGQYPMTYRAFSSIGGYSCINDIGVVSVKYSSIYQYQHYSLYKAIEKELKKIIKKDDKYCFLFYSLIEPQMIRPVQKYCKERNIDAKFVILVPDLIQDLNDSDSLIKKIKLRLFRKWYVNIFDNTDAFILLTEGMCERIPIGEKPYIVVEGLYDTNSMRKKSANNNFKMIFYSGMLHKKFGIKKLLDAFMNVPYDDLRLVLCGTGDQVEYIKKCIFKDNRIKYLGIIDHSAALDYQTEAFLLINPRSAEGEFTKYSFPSKIMEYLASGTPTLIYALPGIPEEYYKYCYVIKENQQDVNVLSNYIMTLYNKPQDELSKTGALAREFIINNKSSIVQSQRIMDLLNSI